MEVVVGLTDALRRAAEYHEGRVLCDEEVLRLLRQDMAGVIARWEGLGRWIIQLAEDA